MNIDAVKSIGDLDRRTTSEDDETKKEFYDELTKEICEHGALLRF